MTLVLLKDRSRGDVPHVLPCVEEGHIVLSVMRAVSSNKAFKFTKQGNSLSKTKAEIL